MLMLSHWTLGLNEWFDNKAVHDIIKLFISSHLLVFNLSLICISMTRPLQIGV